MNTLTAPLRDGAQPSLVIKTTLYELIEAINAVVRPGEEDLVVPAVMHLLDTSHVTFSHRPTDDH